MSKFHLTPKGQARQCSAQSPASCRYSKEAGEVVAHYETKEEAQAAYEKQAEQEHGSTNVLTKPKKLTKAQKEREEGRKHAQSALNNGHDPDRLLKYANQHDAFAKGYTEELKRASEEKAKKLAETNDVKSDEQDAREHVQDAINQGFSADELLNHAVHSDSEWDKAYIEELNKQKENATMRKVAEDYFDENKAQNFSHLSASELKAERDAYVAGAVKKFNDPVAANIRKLEDQADERRKARSERLAAKQEKKDAGLKIVETTADTIRAGDIVHGEKFTESGQWVDNDAKVVKVEESMDLNYSRRMTVTYENGNVAEFTGKAQVRVKRPENAKEGRPAKQMERELRDASRTILNDGYLEDEDAQSALDALNDPNANRNMAIKALNIADQLEENNDHKYSLMFGAAAERIEMRYDSMRKPSRNRAFDLIYDEANTDKEVVKKLEEEYPELAKSARRTRKFHDEVKIIDG